MGFPAMLDPSVSIRDRIVAPGVLGGVAGAVLSLLDVAAPLGIAHVAWPLSLVFYSYGPCSPRSFSAGAAAGGGLGG